MPVVLPAPVVDVFSGGTVLVSVAVLQLKSACGHCGGSMQSPWWMSST